MALLSSHAIQGVVAFPATIVLAVTDGFSAPVPALRPVADATSSEQACSLAVLCPQSPIPLAPLVLRMSLAAVLPAVSSPTTCQGKPPSPVPSAIARAANTMSASNRP
ncbi:MAG: hypothetical protein WBP81_13645 [Solirubrobacteraceae bacterium]